MSRQKKLILLLILFSCIFLTISTASATNITDDNSTLTTNPSNENNDSNSFNDLQNLINDSVNNEVNLEKDYIYHDGDKSIDITKSVIINGNGHTIDAQNRLKIFNIKADNVVIKNIIFKNANGNKDEFYLHYHIAGYSEYNAVKYCSGNFYDFTYFGYFSSFKGGAIYCIGNNLKISNSTFINNIASLGGGIYIKGENSQLINLTFINNTANEGGAIYNYGKNTFVSKSQFDLNYADYAGDSISSWNEINIQNCKFNNTESVIFCGGSNANIKNWQIDNITSNYFNSFVKFGDLNFTFNITHIENDYYTLKIKLIPNEGVNKYLSPEKKEYCKNKNFCLKIAGKIYNLKTNENSIASLNLHIPNGSHYIEVYNPISKLRNTGSFYVLNMPYLNNSINDNINKHSPKLIAKNKQFSKMTKTKKYCVTLKNKDKAMPNTWISLKIKGKIFKAKTNAKGTATFKITKLNKKGTYKAKITFKGNKHYYSVSKNVKINIK